MNTEKFLERWRTAGPTKQLATLLAAVIKAAPNGEVQVAMSDLDDISPGQSVIYYESAGRIHLRFSPEYTTLFTIEESVHERQPRLWQNRSQMPGTSAASLASIPTDAELADLEDRRNRQMELQGIAREARTQPIYTNEKPARSPRTQHRRPVAESEVQ